MINGKTYSAIDAQIKKELEFVKDRFDLNQLLQFQLSHEVQIKRGDGFEYNCIIDGEIYAVANTPLYALVVGVLLYD